MAKKIDRSFHNELHLFRKPEMEAQLRQMSCTLPQNPPGKTSLNSRWAPMYFQAQVKIQQSHFTKKLNYSVSRRGWGWNGKCGGKPVRGWNVDEKWFFCNEASPAWQRELRGPNFSWFVTRDREKHPEAEGKHWQKEKLLGNWPLIYLNWQLEKTSIKSSPSWRLKKRERKNLLKTELHTVWEEGMRCCFLLQTTWHTRPIPTSFCCVLQHCQCCHHNKWKLRALSTSQSQIWGQQRTLRLQFAFLNCWKYWLNRIREEPAGHGIPWPCSFPSEIISQKTCFHFTEQSQEILDPPFYFFHLPGQTHFSCWLLRLQWLPLEGIQWQQKRLMETVTIPSSPSWFGAANVNVKMYKWLCMQF